MLLPAAVACGSVLPSLGRSLLPFQKAGAAVIVLAWIITIIGGYAWHWTWTGYQGNTLWDWLGLLLFLTFLAHLAAALYHGLIRRDGVLSSMTGVGVHH